MYDMQQALAAKLHSYTQHTLYHTQHRLDTQHTKDFMNQHRPATEVHVMTCNKHLQTLYTARSLLQKESYYIGLFCKSDLSLSQTPYIAVFFVEKKMYFIGLFCKRDLAISQTDRPLPHQSAHHQVMQNKYVETQIF